jgi:hypothetical protein
MYVEVEEEPDLHQWFPTSGRDPHQGRGVSDVGSREGCTENWIIIENQNIYLN